MVSKTDLKSNAKFVITGAKSLVRVPNESCFRIIRDLEQYKTALHHKITEHTAVLKVTIRNICVLTREFEFVFVHGCCFLSPLSRMLRRLQNQICTAENIKISCSYKHNQLLQGISHTHFISICLTEKQF